MLENINDLVKNNELSIRIILGKKNEDVFDSNLSQEFYFSILNKIKHINKYYKQNNFIKMTHFDMYSIMCGNVTQYYQTTNKLIEMEEQKIIIIEEKLEIDEIQFPKLKYYDNFEKCKEWIYEMGKYVSIHFMTIDNKYKIEIHTNINKYTKDKVIKELKFIESLVQ